MQAGLAASGYALAGQVDGFQMPPFLCVKKSKKKLKCHIQAC
jgi:hypothetical protein